MITRNDDDLIYEIKGILQHNFNMKNLEALRYFLSIKIIISKSGILLNQRKYALELIA